MTYLFICYPKCTTCQKARKWLEQHQIAFNERHIVENHPTAAELKEWCQRSGKPLKSFINTSGLLYKSMNLKDRLPTMTESEIIELLGTDGMLVKRPLLIGNGKILSGFKPEQWSEIL